ncbi:hypothetical protein ASE12_00435 [Aeromicrobium sp. Root236]|uniref:hypothetical protein n=1 Tax=Aeromicrobium sp. Root236 TaxID=1736498 RepID=UPI0006F380E0|nr:hypothetical protein [Aeromicrobium sp. Root236]KRC63356.1 hypothetical protein ASE12_00435 [Aeromicrobium sp. Root236]
MSTDEVVTAKQASIAGRFARTYLRVCAVACWLFILFWPARLVFGQVEQSWWLATLTILGFVVLMGLLGLVLWFEAASAAADTERLLRDGRDAVAEILDVEVTDPGDGSADVARMQLRISGDDVPEFQAVCKETHDKAYVVGARFNAVVDPSDNLFTLRPLKRR